ncbi:MAG: hypothetical protein ABW208_06030 [Pyrinomonadaceae bacterium]
MSDITENQTHAEVTDETTAEASSTDEKPPQGRRQFFTGMATALGAGIILSAAESASGSERSAAEVRSRILSRIQSDLKRSQNEMLFGYDKPDNDTPHGRYVKAE